MATYAIGDIQGCFDSFERLLGHVGFDASTDRLWIVGDVVNRGPKSLKVLRWLVAHEDSVVMVLGNHDLHLLASAAGIRKTKGRDTLKKILKADDRDHLLTWLRRRPLAHREDSWLMIHAGLWPSWTADDAVRHGGEVSEALRGDDWATALASIYESAPDRWSDGLGLADRMRAAVKGLTRLRYVTADGAYAEGHLGPAWDRSDDRIPWFEATGMPERTETIVFGHWSTLGLYMDGGVIGTDSGCIYGRHLTAVRLEDRAVFQVPAVEGR